MKDLKNVHTSGEDSMSTHEIVNIVLGTRSGYIRTWLWSKTEYYKSYTRKMAELEDSLRKVKQEVASAENNLQNRVNAAETVVENQQTQIQDQQSQIQGQKSQIEVLNSQLNTIVARQEEMYRKMQCFARSSPSRLKVTQFM